MRLCMPVCACFLLCFFSLFCFALLCYAMFCFALHSEKYFAWLCLALLCFALLCYALLCCALLCVLKSVRLSGASRSVSREVSSFKPTVLKFKNLQESAALTGRDVWEATASALRTKKGNTACRHAKLSPKKHEILSLWIGSITNLA